MNFLTVSSQQALFWISGERFHVYITTKICEQESDMFWSSPHINSIKKETQFLHTFKKSSIHLEEQRRALTTTFSVAMQCRRLF